MIECKGGEGRLALVQRKQKEAELPPDLQLGVVPSGESLVVSDCLPAAEGVPDTARAMLAVLDEIADEDGVSAGVWQRACGQEGGVRMSVDQTFHRHAKTLGEDGYADKLGKGNQTRYTVTEQGRHLIGAGVRKVRTQ